MNFKDEYKNEMQNISPTEEQFERIRGGVMRKLSETAPVKRKKPLYLKIAAVSGAAVCAAAVAIVIFAGTRSTIHIGGSTNMVASPAAPENSLTGNAANDGSVNDNYYQSSSITGCYTDGAKDSSAGPGSTHEAIPSQGDTPDSGNPEGGPPTGGGVSDDPYLRFSEDKSSCVVTKDGAAYTYYSSDDNISGFSSEDKAIAADTNLDTELFVQFDENIMTVFLKDGSLFGVYIK